MPEYFHLENGVMFEVTNLTPDEINQTVKTMACVSEITKVTIYDLHEVLAYFLRSGHEVKPADYSGYIEFFQLIQKAGYITLQDIPQYDRAQELIREVKNL